MQEKICNKCNTSKPLTDYTFSKICKYGVRNTCKECRKIERKEYINRPEVRAASKQYYQDNKESFRKRMSIHYYSLNGQYHNYKKRAVKANMVFELTEKDCLPYYNTNCAYCGGKIKGIGIDRVDNSIGYVKSNLKPCCSTCNYMKHTLTLNEFLEHMKKILNYYKPS